MEGDSKPDDRKEKEWIKKQKESNERIESLLVLKGEIEKVWLTFDFINNNLVQFTSLSIFNERKTVLIS